MDRKNIYSIIQKYAPKEAEIKDDSRFIEDFGWSSLTMLMFIIELEETWGRPVNLGRFKQVRTVSDLVAVISEEGETV